MVKKRIWANLLRIELFTPKMDIKLSKIWVGNKVRDPEKNLLRIPDPGGKKAPDSGSATLIK
jgi:hypothetical protein